MEGTRAAGRVGRRPFMLTLGETALDGLRSLLGGVDHDGAADSTES